MAVPLPKHGLLWTASLFFQRQGPMMMMMMNNSTLEFERLFGKARSHYGLA
jgi:hypothetical protein